ncbi:hypothetical protein Bca52824_094490 [Brassica carinata]|uniref:Uncharacterized protein n=1 Tax=Brassica carinata TaxID=52824 RepID=A0A8X7P3X0_BRACI|nr:hypothetical protein Bca52824_094490 [Brassica carinata]
MVMKREEMAPKGRSLFGRGSCKLDRAELAKSIRFSFEHGCMVMDLGPPSNSSTSTIRGSAHIYTRDLISTIGSRDTRDVTPNLGENSSITNDYKDWGTDLSL